MKPEQWIEDFANAWEARSDYQFGALFVPDASYRGCIFDRPLLGRHDIQLYWEKLAGQQEDIKVRIGEPVTCRSIGGAERTAVEWWTTMVDPEKGPVSLTGVFLLRFAEDGLCEDLWEYSEIKERMREPPAEWGQIQGANYAMSQGLVRGQGPNGI